MGNFLQLQGNCADSQLGENLQYICPLNPQFSLSAYHSGFKFTTLAVILFELFGSSLYIQSMK